MVKVKLELEEADYNLLTKTILFGLGQNNENPIDIIHLFHTVRNQGYKQLGEPDRSNLTPTKFFKEKDSVFEEISKEEFYKKEDLNNKKNLT